MEACLRVGIGDLIICKAMLTSVSDPCVNITLDESLLPLRGGESYRSFISNFSSLLFQSPKFSFKGIKTGNSIGWDDLYRGGIRPIPLPLQGQLCAGRKPCEDKYVCVYTKIRDYNRGLFDRGQSKIRAALETLVRKYKVVLLGEREIERNVEYITLTPSAVYSAYSMVSDFPQAIDLTIPKLGMTSPNIDKFIQDCAIMAGAEVTINIGVGGNLLISSAVGRSMSLVQSKISVLTETFPDRYSEYYHESEFATAIGAL